MMININMTLENLIRIPVTNVRDCPMTGYKLGEVIQGCNKYIIGTTIAFEHYNKLLDFYVAKVNKK